MTKLCILSQKLADDAIFSQSFNNDCILKILDDGDVFDLSDGNLCNITHFSFFYHYPGSYLVPFLLDDLSLNHKYTFFGNEFIERVKEIKAVSGVNLIIDLVSCNLMGQSFIDEVARFENEFGVNIRYSIDITGNNPGGNWVMESDNVDIKDIYFTSNIDSWEGHLNNASIDIDSSFFSTDNTDFFDYDSTNKIVKLKQDLSGNNSWYHLTDANVGDVLNYVVLKDGWTFDGSGHTIVMNGNTDSSIWYKTRGLFTSSATEIANAPTIKNLTLEGGPANGTRISINYGGAFVRSHQQFFTIENCNTGGNIKMYNSNQGYITGAYPGYNGGHAIIRDCSNSSEYVYLSYSNHGGIVGIYAGYKGTCKIYNCTNNVNFSSRTFTGGIAGRWAGAGGSSTTSGYCLISGCTNNGGFNQYAGGIAGASAARYGILKIINCTNNGNMGGVYSGGIVGYGACMYGGSMTIVNCHNTTNVDQKYSGGIVGANAASHSGSTITIKNSSNTGTISQLGAGGIFGEKAGSDNYTQHGTITVTNCFNNSTITGMGSGGVFGRSASGNITIDSCYSICNMSSNDSSISCFFGDNLGVMSSSTSIAKIKVSRSYAINTNSSTSNRCGFIGGVESTSGKYYQVLVSHCYASGCDRGLVNLDQTLLSDAYFVITNSYNNSDNICTLKSDETNTSNVKINNSYSNSGSGSNPKNASAGSSTGNYDFDGDITDSTSFDSSELNTATTLSTIQGWYSTWESSLVPPQDTDIFVYDSGVLLSNFQNSPWSGYTEYNSTPTIGNIISTTTTTSYTVGNVTLPVNHIIVHSFSNETAFSDWINGEGDNPKTIVDIDISNGVPIFTKNIVPTTGKKSFITDEDYIVFETDSGDVSYNFEDEIGSNYTHTIDGTDYKISFIFVGSGGGIIEPASSSTPTSGGDPHIIPLGQKNKIYDLPCKHGANYQYLAYEKFGESVVVNVMTQIVTIDDPKNSEKNEIVKNFISKCRDYVKYLYICYTNKETGVKEELCYDLFKMKCVNYNLKNFDSLAYNCSLPVSKKYADKLKNIKLSKKILKNKKFIGYKANNKEHQIITIYTGYSKFELIVGKAKDNPVFGTYMCVDKYPQDTLHIGRGLLVDPRKYKPITNLKSRNKQLKNKNNTLNK